MVASCSASRRDAYFRLARALTLASSAESLRVPTFRRNAEDISVEKLKKYRAKLVDEYRAKLTDENRAELADEYRVVLAAVERLDEDGAEPPKDEVFDDVEHWKFGCSVPEDDSPEHRFQDYVFLQRLSSALRTMLSEDLCSRRRPS